MDYIAKQERKTLKKKTPNIRKILKNNIGMKRYF